MIEENISSVLTNFFDNIRNDIEDGKTIVSINGGYYIPCISITKNNVLMLHEIIERIGPTISINFFNRDIILNVCYDNGLRNAYFVIICKYNKKHYVIKDNQDFIALGICSNRKEKITINDVLGGINYSGVYTSIELKETIHEAKYQQIADTLRDILKNNLNNCVLVEDNKNYYLYNITRQYYIPNEKYKYVFNISCENNFKLDFIINLIFHKKVNINAIGF